MHGDVGAGIAAGDPLGELAAGDALRLEQRAVAVVDVLQLAVGDQRAQFLVVGIEQLVIDDLGQHAACCGRVASSSSSSAATAPTAFRSARACRPRAPPGRPRSGDRRAWRRRRNRRPRPAIVDGPCPGEALNGRCRAPAACDTPRPVCPCGRRRPARTSTSETPGHRGRWLRPARKMGGTFRRNHPHADHAGTQDASRVGSGRRSGEGWIDGRVHGREFNRAV